MDQRDYITAASTMPAGPSRATALKRRETWNRFEAWCTTRGYRALPMSTAVVETYVREHTGKLAPLTLKTRVEHLRAVCRAQGAHWPEDDEPVRAALARAKAYGTHRGGHPLLERDLVDLGRHLTSAGTAEAVRDWALIAVGADGGLDATELSHLRPGDVDWGEDEVALRLTEHRPWLGDVRLHAHVDGERCPLRALAAWMAVREDAPTVFHLPDRRAGLRRLDPHDVTAIVRARMREIGRNPAAYSWLSLRVTRLLAAQRPRHTR
jgi:integrase